MPCFSFSLCFLGSVIALNGFSERACHVRRACVTILRVLLQSFGDYTGGAARQLWTQITNTLMPALHDVITQLGNALPHKRQSAAEQRVEGHSQTKNIALGPSNHASQALRDHIAR